MKVVNSLPCCFLGVSLVVGDVWFILAVVVFPFAVVAVDFVVGVDFVVAALLLSSPGHMKKEPETDREMNWTTKQRCLGRLICFLHLFIYSRC